MSLVRSAVRAVIPVLALVFGARNAEAMPKAGQTAPEFTLIDQNNKAVSLKDQRGHWVVLYFYPKDFTSGCTLQARNFQRDLAKYAERDAVVLGVSVDDVDTHGQFCEKENLSFSLLADTDVSVSRAYGSVMRLPGKRLSARNTFLIDPKGQIVRVWKSVDVAGHSKDVLNALDDARK
jgi:peroxiredoxin Q/BCP